MKYSFWALQKFYLKTVAEIDLNKLFILLCLILNCSCPIILFYILSLSLPPLLPIHWSSHSHSTRRDDNLINCECIWYSKFSALFWILFGQFPQNFKWSFLIKLIARKRAYENWIFNELYKLKNPKQWTKLFKYYSTNYATLHKGQLRFEQKSILILFNVFLW